MRSMKLKNRTDRFLSLLAGALLLPGLSFSAEADSEALFVRRVWPLFQEKCLACHGQDETKIKGGLDMRTLAATLKGGDSEKPGLVPGKADQSPLYLATLRNHEDWEPMPPKENEKLTPEQQAWIQEWITLGAAWPDETRRTEIAHQSADRWSAEDGVMVKTVGARSPDWANRRYKPEALWGYQPVKKPEIPAKTGNATHPIDALIQQRLPEGMESAPRADPRTFIRRATYDLTGLPPTSEEIESFLQVWNQEGAEQATQNLINRLLDSPHYGEQMARHWLDVVRYADSSGFANDYERGNAWRYRDYVVRSFNHDKPYNQFILEQIAGDEMASVEKSDVNPYATEPTSNSELLIATGFLRMGPWELTSMEVPKVARQRFLDDVTNSVGETFLAHSLQCARCHDHKFDPVPTHDYYAMQACFSTTQLAELPAPFLASENTAGFEERKYLEARREGHLKELQQLDDIHLKGAEAWHAEKKIDRSRWDQAVANARTFIAQGGKRKRGDFQGVFDIARNGLLNKQKLPESEVPPKGVGFSPADYGRERVARKGLERLKWELERYEPFAFSVYDGRTPQRTSVFQPLRMPEDRLTEGELEQTAILSGGDPFSPTQPVKPGVLSALFTLPTLQASLPEAIEGRRLALARWIARPDNPLTTRSIVNRLWLWHFGQALAGNPNNFGSTGKKPTHPELLDWLAATLIEKNWSLKEMHRLIMTSEAYRRSTSDAGTLARTDHATAASTATTSKDTAGRSARITFSREDLESHYAVFKPRRLTAEELRDSMLSVTGELNPLLGGIPNRPEINIEVAMQPRQVMGTFASAWVPNPLPTQRHRRSLYALKIRGLRDPFMEVFNEPGPDFSCEAREISTVTPQVFSLFNGQASYNRALALANRVLKESPQTPLSRLFHLAYGRAPTPEEEAACQAHWEKSLARQQSATPPPAPRPPLEMLRDAVEENTGEKFRFQEALHAYADFLPDLQSADVDVRTRALADVCLVLMNSNEFAYVY